MHESRRPRATVLRGGLLHEHPLPAVHERCMPGRCTGSHRTMATIVVRHVLLARPRCTSSVSSRSEGEGATPVSVIMTVAMPAPEP